MKRPVLAALALLAAAGGASAQRPGEITGVVVDAMTAAAIDGASVTIDALHRSVMTDAAGRFRLSGIEPGAWELAVVRLGYVDRALRVAVRNGANVHLTVRLHPQPLLLDDLSAAAARDDSGALHIDRVTLERTGARTAGDALRAVPGLIVQSAGPGSAQTVSMRGMASDAVLVLVDGVPLNDPVTGEADLSLVAASAIESITVLPGAQSARFGARAAAGVIRIETRRGGEASRSFALGIGSVGGRDAGIAWGGGETTQWTVGASTRALDGDFTFALPDAAGGGERRRQNAHVRAQDAFAGLETRLAKGRLSARIGIDRAERGLPGRGYAPSPNALQESERARAGVQWRVEDAASSLDVLLAGALQDITNRDPAPPVGLPWSDSTRAAQLEARLDVERALGADHLAGAGVELRLLDIDGTVLRGDAPEVQTDAGVFVHGDAALGGVLYGLRVAAQGRVDRDPIDGDAVASHSVRLGWTHGGLGLHLAHRSSYSPPTLGDRFFREAVGIEPNPDLRGERIPGELEAGARMVAALAGWTASLRATAYSGDIEGMILWAPDYRFVWSPTNQDAKRGGIEAGAELSAPDRRARLAASWTAVRVTYDRGDGDDDVQIAYRPRHSGLIEAMLSDRGTTLDVALRYTGARTTVPSRLNTLAGFWTIDAALLHERSVADWRVALDLRVERLLDEKDSLIFGFPEPGRVVRFGVRIAPPASPPLLTHGAR